MRILVVSVLLAAVISVGCPFSTPEPVLIREPRPEPVPLRVGVYYSPEFRDFTYRHHFSDTAWILGEPSVKLIREALGLLFIEVVEVPRPSLGTDLRGDLAGGIEPRIVSAAYEVMFPQPYFPVHITYGFTVYSPSGAPVASWNVTGRENQLFRNPLATADNMKGNFEHAMREAAWKFISGFHDISEVRHWLAKQTSRKD